MRDFDELMAEQPADVQAAIKRRHQELRASACKMRQRKDDIPKRSRKEKSWECETCGALAFSERKPICRLEMQGTLNALHAAAEADLHDIQTKGKP